MKLGKILIVVGLIAVGILSLNLQARAGSPAGENAVYGDDEYWGALIINCRDDEVYLRVKRVVDCVVETDSMIVLNAYEPGGICTLIDDSGAGIILGQLLGYNQVIFEQQGVPTITKVKNVQKDNYNDPNSDPNNPPYQGDIYSMDVQIRLCTSCVASP